MNRKSSVSAALFAVALALLLCTAAVAAPVDSYRPDRISMTGRITSISREGDLYSIGLNRGTYTYLVPAATVGSRNLYLGEPVRIGGFISGDTVNADYIALTGESGYARDPSYVTVPYGSSGWMSGTVTRLHQHYHWLELRDDATGLPVKVDVRNMDEKRSVNVWRTRPGDRINVLGSWENRETFDANRVMY